MLSPRLIINMTKELKARDFTFGGCDDKMPAGTELKVAGIVFGHIYPALIMLAKSKVNRIVFVVSFYFGTPLTGWVEAFKMIFTRHCKPPTSCTFM